MSSFPNTPRGQTIQERPKKDRTGEITGAMNGDGPIGFGTQEDSQELISRQSDGRIAL